MPGPLLHALERLQDATTAFAPSAAHWLPDIVILGYLADLRESSLAASMLIDASPPQHATPTARAAFEAEQNLLLLVTADGLDHAGSLAYLYGLRKDHDISLAHAAEISDKPPEEGGPGWLEAAVSEIRDTWESLSPGKSQVVSDAAAELNARWSSKPDNWARVNPAKALNDRLPRYGLVTKGGSHDIGTVFRNAYRALNRDTHPRTVVRPISVRRDSHGCVHTEVQSRDLAALAESAGIICTAAANMAVGAMVIRGSIA